MPFAEGLVARPLALEALSNGLMQTLPGEACLALEDDHLVNQEPAIHSLVEHLVALLPPRPHLIIATRQAPRPAGRDPAFSEEEIEALLRTQYSYRSPPRGSRSQPHRSC